MNRYIEFEGKIVPCNEYELESRYSSQQSFYGKAKVIDLMNGIYLLQSYETIVAKADHGKVETFGYYSNTTSRHQKEFKRQFSY